MLTKRHGPRRVSHDQKEVEEKHYHEDDSAEEFEKCLALVKI